MHFTFQSPGLFADYAFLFIGAFGGLSQGMQAYINRVQLLNFNLHLFPPPPLSLSLSLSPPPSLLVDHLAQLIQLSGGTLVSSMEESTTRGNTTTCVVCDEEKFTQLQLPSGCGLVRVKSGWILDCLSNYR